MMKNNLVAFVSQWMTIQPSLFCCLDDELGELPEGKSQCETCGATTRAEAARPTQPKALLSRRDKTHSKQPTRPMRRQEKRQLLDLVLQKPLSRGREAIHPERQRNRRIGGNEHVTRRPDRRIDPVNGIPYGPFGRKGGTCQTNTDKCRQGGNHVHHLMRMAMPAFFSSNSVSVCLSPSAGP